MTVTNGGQQCIMVNPNRNNHLSMLPQAPTPGLMPSAASVQGLLPQSPSTLVPVPAHHRIQQAVAVTASPTNILPPTLLNRQLFSRTVQEANHDGSHLRSRLEMAVETQASASPRTPSATSSRNVVPSSRQQQRDRRSLPCQLALQDHNYVSRPPPTPSPPPPPPLPVLQPPTVLQVTQDGRKRLQSGGVVVPAG